jgi:lipopolysaccharide export system permease protein
MKILTRSILALFFRLLGLCLGAFGLIFLVIEFLDKMRRFSRVNADAVTIAFYFLNKLPEIISQVIPFGVLLATILTLGVLVRNNELTALRSSGISLRAIGRPLLAAALLLSVLTFISNELLLPVTVQNIRDIEETKLKRNEYGAVFRQHNIWFRDGSLVMRAELFDPGSKTLKGVTLWDKDGYLPRKRIEAEEGSLTPRGWQFSRARIWTFQHDTQVDVTQVATMAVPLRLTMDDLKKVADYTSSMGFFELRRYARDLKKGGYDVTRYLADMHARAALPFSACVMVLLGMPFAVRSGRSVSAAFGIGQSLAIGFAYFVFNALLISLGHNGLLPPLLAAWAANSIFAMIGIWLMLTLEQ